MESGNIMLIRKPNSFYSDAILQNIFKYKNMYRLNDAFFYYYKTRIYLSKLPSPNWLGFRMNWGSIEKEVLTLYFVACTPLEGEYQFSYSTQFFPTQSIYYIPFNFLTKGVVFTDNVGTTRTADGSTAKIFSVGKKILSTINASVAPRAFSDPQAAIIHLGIDGRTGTAYGPKLDVDQVLMAPASTAYSIVGPISYDQVIVYPEKGSSSKLVYVGGKEDINNYYFNPSLVIPVAENLQYYIITLPKFSNNNTNSGFPNALTTTTFGDVDGVTTVPIYNMFVATSPVIGNNTLAYLSDLNYNTVGTPVTTARQIITPADCLLGDVNITAASDINNGITITPSSQYIYYMVTRSAASTQANPPNPFRLYSQYRFQYNNNSYFTSVVPVKIITWRDEFLQWQLYTTNSDPIGDITYYVYNNTNWKYTDVVPPGYSFYSVHNSIAPRATSIDYSQSTKPYFKNQTGLISNFISPNIPSPINLTNRQFGAVSQYQNNYVILKNILYDAIYPYRGSNYLQAFRNRPEASGTINGAGDLNNQKYIKKWCSQSFTSNTLSTIHCTDDNNFQSGMRMFAKFRDEVEVNGFCFVCTQVITMTVVTSTNTIVNVNGMTLYRTRDTYRIPTILGTFKRFMLTSQSTGIAGAPENLTVFTSLAKTTRQSIPPALITNGVQNVSFVHDINNQTEFRIFFDNVPNTATSTVRVFTLHLQ